MNSTNNNSSASNKNNDDNMDDDEESPVLAASSVLEEFNDFIYLPREEKLIQTIQETLDDLIVTLRVQRVNDSPGADPNGK